LTAGHVPLWAKYPQTGETQALKTLLVTQFVASALLFPILVRTLPSAVTAIVTAWPFAMVAAALSSTPTPLVVWAESDVSLWLVALYAWRSILRSTRSLGIGSAVAVCLVLSGPISVYLMTDFAAGSASPAPLPPVQAAPLVYAFSLLTGDRPHAPVPLGLLLLLLPPLVSLAYRRYRERASA
jgi:hypothetical protein